MPDLTIKAGDTYPPLVTTLEENGGPLDLTTATSITMRMASDSPPSAVDDLVCAVVGDPTQGVVEYEWQAGDTDVPGTYKVDFVIDFGTGQLQTVPNETEKEIVIRAAIA